jgi:hypothetical protein
MRFSSYAVPEYRRVNLKVPTLLRTLIDAGQWQHPGDEILLRVIPLLPDPVDFRVRVPDSTVAAEIQDSFTPIDWETFKMYRDGEPDKPLPWLNADQAAFIAINRFPGDDVAIALDYRASKENPRVVASHWRDNKYLEWFEVAKSFEAFAQLLSLTTA